MPVIQRKGAQSSQGFGEFAQSSTAANYIEDYFSTYLYTGTGAAQTISNGIGLADTAAWSSYKLQQNNSYGIGITTDSSGNFYVTGYANDGTNDYALIAKYNSSGTIQWQRKLTQNSGNGNAITTDTSGNVYVTGFVDDGTNYYIIVAKYDSSGTIQWQRKLLENFSVGYGITTDTSGNVYVTGRASSGSAYIIIAKYDSTGAIQWQRKLQQSSSEGSAISTDSSGNIYVTGNAYDGSAYIIIAKYDSTGAIQWQRKLKQNASEGKGISTDSSGNVYVSGFAYDGTHNYIIVAKYNSSGTIQWQRKLKQNNSNGNKISIDSSGNIYVSGQVLDGTKYYIIVAKYNSSGTIQWQRKLQQNNSVGLGIAADTSGNIYVTGYATDSSSVNYFVTSKLKQDGTTTAGTAFVTMVPGALTESAGTATDSAGTATDSAGTATDSAGTATDSAGTATATSATQAAITGAGGLVWIKDRLLSTSTHVIMDTVRGVRKILSSSTTNGELTSSPSEAITSFNANGFTLGTDYSSTYTTNTSSSSYVSWTFREQAKFFDVVTYTGNGANRTISHNLGSVPGCIIIKRTDTTAAWAVYHRSLANTEYLVLNTTAAKATGATYWNSTTPTSTVFSLGTSTDVNANGGTYVAYLFAHDAGGFGSAGTDNVISCGSVTTSGQTTVNLGYEPQFVIIKSSSVINNWHVVDNVRGWQATGGFNELFPNSSTPESTSTNNTLNLTSTGFDFNPTVGSWNGNGTYVYIAIRRGPMKTPTSGTSVFGINARAGTGANATVTGGQTDDAALIKNRGSAVADLFSSRLTGTGYLVTSTTAAEVAAGTTILQANPWDVMDGVKVGTTSTITNASANTFINYLFQRAPSFFDVVCYTGTGVNNRAVNHSLSVVPELMIGKVRSGFTDNWYVSSNLIGDGNRLKLNLNSSVEADGDPFFDWSGPYTQTASSFYVGTSAMNSGVGTYIVYLFASCPGVSKVGSYTGTGALQTVNCGFTSGARFVLIKRTDSTGDWYVWDSARGISSGNDPYFLLNSAAAQVTGTNYVDTDTTGFKVTAAAPVGINASGGTYIFLAIA